jgi:hypothetical protein
MASAISATDLTKRVEDWFDYFLKGDTTPGWIYEGTD